MKKLIAWGVALALMVPGLARAQGTGTSAGLIRLPGGDQIQVAGWMQGPAGQVNSQILGGPQPFGRATALGQGPDNSAFSTSYVFRMADGTAVGGNFQLGISPTSSHLGGASVIAPLAGALQVEGSVLGGATGGSAGATGQTFGPFPIQAGAFGRTLPALGPPVPFPR
jgi:hypothetical protein